MLRKEIHARIYWDEKNKTKLKTMQFEEINQKILVKEGVPSKIMKENPNNTSVEKAQGETYDWMQRKQNNFRVTE